MNGNTLEKRDNSIWSDHASDKGEVVDLSDSRNENESEAQPRRRGLFGLFAELRRRKVCRAATAYCVALWLTCQVVDVVSAPLGLPDWTLELIILLGLVGFPIALILSWLFEVTPEGLVLDNEAIGCCGDTSYDARRSRFDQVIDCSLLLVAIVIGAELALTSIGPGLLASPVPREELHISRFSVVSESNSEALSGALQVELQYAIARLSGVKVIVPDGSWKISSGSSLRGSVSVGDNDIQVTAIVVNNQTGELAWSEVLRFSIKDSGGTPRSIASGIVSAMEQWPVVDRDEGGRGDG